MIILRDYQDILWTKSLSGGCEYCEANQGRPLQLTDFFNILRPQNIEIEGRKFWVYKHGPIELVIMRTWHFPDTAISVDESQVVFGSVHQPESLDFGGYHVRCGLSYSFCQVGGSHVS